MARDKSSEGFVTSLVTLFVTFEFPEGDFISIFWVHVKFILT